MDIKFRKLIQIVQHLRVLETEMRKKHNSQRHNLRKFL